MTHFGKTLDARSFILRRCTRSSKAALFLHRGRVHLVAKIADADIVNVRENWGRHNDHRGCNVAHELRRGSEYDVLAGKSAGSVRIRRWEFEFGCLILRRSADGKAKSTP
jgi:hypothetical protein